MGRKKIKKHSKGKKQKEVRHLSEEIQFGKFVYANNLDSKSSRSLFIEPEHQPEGVNLDDFSESIFLHSSDDGEFSYLSEDDDESSYLTEDDDERSYLSEDDDEFSYLSEDPQKSEIIEAVKQKDYQALDALLVDKSNHDINALEYVLEAWEPRKTALIQALELGLWEIIEKLLDHNADPNLFDDHPIPVGEPGMSPLMISLQDNNCPVKVVKLLFKYGADPNMECTVMEEMEEDYYPCRYFPIWFACEAFKNNSNSIVALEKLKLLIGINSFKLDPQCYPEGQSEEDEDSQSVKTLIRKVQVKAILSRVKGLVKAFVVFRRIRLSLLHEKYQPGGLGFHEAKQHFETLSG